MSHILTPHPTSPSGLEVNVPNPGDSRSAASVTDAPQALLNAIAWLYGILNGSIAKDITITAEGGGDPALNVNGNVSIVGSTSMSGGVSAGSAYVYGDAQVNDLTVGNAIHAGGNLAVGGSTVLQDVNVHGPLQFVAPGRPTLKTKFTAATAGMTISPATANYWRFTTAADGTIITIDDSLAVDGDFLHVTNPNTNTLELKKPDGSTLTGVMRSGDGYSPASLVIRDGGVWKNFENFPWS